jgi:hypothetical protein
MTKTRKVLKEDFEVIFNKIEKTFEYIYINIEGEPHIYEYDTKTIYIMPEGYAAYDKHHYYRKF